VTDSALAVLAGFDGHRHDPAALVRAVDELVAAGKPTALCVLRESAASSGPCAESAVLAARVAFPHSRDGSPPPLALGAPDVGPPEDPAAFALFPVALQDAWPFLLVGGYSVGGESDFGAIFDWIERTGILRERPLRPSASPESALEALIASDPYRQLGTDAEHDEMLRAQARRAAGVSG